MDLAQLVLKLLSASAALFVAAYSILTEPQSKADGKLSRKARTLLVVAGIAFIVSAAQEASSAATNAANAKAAADAEENWATERKSTNSKLDRAEQEIRQKDGELHWKGMLDDARQVNANLCTSRNQQEGLAPVFEADRRVLLDDLEAGVDGAALRETLRKLVAADASCFENAVPTTPALPQPPPIPSK